MRIKTSLKAGRAEGHGGGTLGWNHNQTTVRSSEGLRVRTNLKVGTTDGGLSLPAGRPSGGGWISNHNQTAVRASNRARVK